MTQITLVILMRISVICKYHLQCQHLSCFHSKRTTMLINVNVCCACLTTLRLKGREKLSDSNVEREHWGRGKLMVSLAMV